MNIYKQILEKKGYILALAPMEGVTDTVFRQVICEIGKPDLFFTEFLNVEVSVLKVKRKLYIDWRLGTLRDQLSYSLGKCS